MIVSPIAFLLATFLALVRSWFVFKVRMEKKNNISVKIIDFLNNLFSTRNIVTSFIIIPFDWRLKSKITLHIDILAYLIYATIVCFLITYSLEL